MSMLAVILLGALSLGVQQQTDTTFAIAAGGRLSLESLNGSVVVRSWDREAMQVRATHPANARIVIRNRGGVVALEARHAGQPDSPIAYEIMVPRRFSVSVNGVRMRTTVEDVRGSIHVSNAEGDVTVRNVTGDVGIESVNGALHMEDVRGAVKANTVNQSIRLRRVRGEISVSTINGGIVMTEIDAARVEASTVNGAVEYMGTVQDGGRYYLGTHNGQITMGVPERGNASVSVSTRTGRVDSAFPVSVSSVRDGRLSFTVGSGSATIELESFNGAVRLVRPRPAR